MQEGASCYDKNKHRKVLPKVLQYGEKPSAFASEIFINVFFRENCSNTNNPA